MVNFDKAVSQTKRYERDFVQIVDTAPSFANYFSDGMVLQGAPDKASVWGFADSAGGSVSVILDGTEVATGSVDSNRKWQAMLPVTEAGGPHTIEVSAGGSSATLTDVMFGDVWFCAGQSNMVVEIYRVGIDLL